MNSRTTRRFRALYAALPAHVQRQAREAYRLFQPDPAHPGLHFKQVHADPPTTWKTTNCWRRRRAISKTTSDGMRRSPKTTMVSNTTVADLLLNGPLPDLHSDSRCRVRF